MSALEHDVLAALLPALVVMGIPIAAVGVLLLTLRFWPATLFGRCLWCRCQLRWGMQPLLREHGFCSEDCCMARSVVVDHAQG